eukprot:CAMPEP_0197437664 /NCGR_PEP_ID=MMETSP1175-20131217/4852_1 /TAXON_ID=1003142 /ORGANISM="Triceratium dubium, Strain CCMP147" /LENGTH=511 /DNA_ID=CAMNT_0042967241 /DNA_START=43 /DNA_END=1578 /DNA_ORIENTATION=+
MAATAITTGDTVRKLTNATEQDKASKNSTTRARTQSALKIVGKERRKEIAYQSEARNSDMRKPDFGYARHCREKNWAEVAKALFLSSASAEVRARYAEDILRDIDSHRVPTRVIIDAVSLCVRGNHDSRRHLADVPWPNNMPVTRCVVDRKGTALRSVGNFLSSSWPSSAKRSVVRLLLASQADFKVGADVAPMLQPLPVCIVEKKRMKRSRCGTVTDSTKKLQDCSDVLVPTEDLSRICGVDGEEKETVEEEQSIAIERGESIAARIADGAEWVESSIAGRAACAVRGIDAAGSFISERVPPKEMQTMNRRDRIVMRTYTNAAKRISGGIKVTVNAAASGVRGASALGVQKLTQQVHDRNLASKVVPDREQRDVLQAVGTVSLAALGAVVVVSEALYDGSVAVVEKTAFVTSDIIKKRHGEDAGKIAQDTCESMSNVLKTVKYVKGLRGTAVSKGVVKNSGKVKIKGESAMHQAPSRDMTVEYVQDLQRKISPLEDHEFYRSGKDQAARA